MAARRRNVEREKEHARLTRELAEQSRAVIATERRIAELKAEVTALGYDLVDKKTLCRDTAAALDRIEGAEGGA